MAKLIVFIHGLGADEYDWWGSTKNLLEEVYKEEDVDFYFYRYTTEKISILNKIKLFFGFGTNLVDLGGLGRVFANELENYIDKEDKNYDEIKLFGHSMGGIVIASSLWILKEKKEIFSKITSIAICGTPLGGSRIATRVSKISPFISKHTKLLKYRNKKLQQVIQSFFSIVTTEYEDNKPYLSFFEIEDDEVVQTEEEKFADLIVEQIRKKSYSMTGGHVGAVQNLSIDSKEFFNIRKWIDEDAITHNISEEYKDNFKKFINKMYISKDKGITKRQLKDAYLNYIEEPSTDKDGNRKRPYIDISLNARKTYLQERNGERKAIIDFRRIVKVVDNSYDCEFEFTNGFIKGSKYAENEELKKIIQDLENNIRNQGVDRFKSNVLNIAYKINDSQLLHYPQSLQGREALKILGNYETETTKGLRIICNLGKNFSIGDEIELLVSLTLPVAIWDFPDDRDKFSFPLSTIERKYVIQEEIYGSNEPRLIPTIINGDTYINKKRDRSLYYERFVFYDTMDKEFKTIEISYRRRD
jgi:hypothetical protein